MLCGVLRGFYPSKKTRTAYLKWNAVVLLLFCIQLPLGTSATTFKPTKVLLLQKMKTKFRKAAFDLVHRGGLF